MEENSSTPLKEISEAFAGLAADVSRAKSSSVHSEQVQVAKFANACDRISVLFGCLGIAFKFAEKDYVAKVKDLQAAGKEFNTLPEMIDGDISTDTVRLAGSHARNLLRVKRGVDMVHILFQHILITPGNSLREPASTAYDQVFSRHHGWAIRKAVSAGMYVLPSKSHFLSKLNEQEDSAQEYMRSFATSADPVVEYVNGLFTSRELGVDW
ncbi:unnamed protein product [Calypogeia fissa]